MDTAPKSVPGVPRGYAAGHCQHCKAPVFWAVMVDVAGTVQRHPNRQAKRLPPLNRERVPTGTVLLVEGGAGRGRFITPYEAAKRREQDQPDPLHEVHTCPAGTRKRRARR